MLAFHWLLQYRHSNMIIIHDGYADKVSRATEGSTSISQSIIDIVSDVKQSKFETDFNTLWILCPEL
jgi:hypothetical protein